MVSETWQRKPADTVWWWAYPGIKCCMQSINTVCVSLMSDVSMGGEPQGGKLLKMKPELESQTAVRQMFFKLSDSLTLCLNFHRLSSLTPECWNPLTLFNCEWTQNNRMDVKKRKKERKKEKEGYAPETCSTKDSRKALLFMWPGACTCVYMGLETTPLWPHIKNTLYEKVSLNSHVCGCFQLMRSTVI